MAYFCNNYGHVQEGAGGWTRFQLWPKQIEVCDWFDLERFIACLKARQLGLSWIAVHEAVQTMLLKPGSKVGLFSLRENEAKDLLRERVKQVYNRLPVWLKPKNPPEKDEALEFKIGNGSRCMAFSTNSGDSYTFDLVVVDEADLVPNLQRMLGSVKPTIDAGGRIRLISRANKDLPLSTFKRIYMEGAKGKNSYKAIFLPWHARPDRTQQWYENEKRDSLSNTGSLDYIYEQYPATPEECLAANTSSKRLPMVWVKQCYQPILPLTGADIPSVPGLVVFRRPNPERRYVVGADLAEGKDTSDESSATFGDLLTGEEVAVLAGQFEPGMFASYVATVARWFNKADVLPERNNHGHAFILAMRDNYRDINLLVGPDGSSGWLSNAKGNTLKYATLADALRDNQAIIHDEETHQQLASIEKRTLKAPEGLADDRADSFGLMLKAAELAAGTAWVAPEPLPQPDKKPWLPGADQMGSKGMFGIGRRQP